MHLALEALEDALKKGAECQVRRYTLHFGREVYLKNAKSHGGEVLVFVAGKCGSHSMTIKDSIY